MEVTAQTRLATAEQSQRDQTYKAGAAFTVALNAAQTSESGSRESASPDGGHEGGLGPLGNVTAPDIEHLVATAISGVTVRSSPTEGVIVDAGNSQVALAIDAVAAPLQGLAIRTHNSPLPSPLPAEAKTHLSINGSPYDDWIEVSSDVAVPLTIRGLGGNDDIWGGSAADNIQGGSGNDYIDAGSGNDAVDGGDGYDVIYGQHGEDEIHGGGGRDYIDGGSDNDTLSGDGGKDILSGGRGADNISGGADDDVIITASGRDDVKDQDGINKVYTEGDDISVNSESRIVPIASPAEGLGRSISYFGDISFVNRIESDLETLKHLPVGQKALTSLDASKRSTLIREPTEEEKAEGVGAVAKRGDNIPARVLPGEITDATIGLDPTNRSLDQTNNAQDWRARPPIVPLVHEMAHAQDMVHGTMPLPTIQNGQVIENSELSATGLRWDQDGDGVKDDNNRPVSENVVRDELGLDRRPYYYSPGN